MDKIGKVGVFIFSGNNQLRITTSLTTEFSSLKRSQGIDNPWMFRFPIGSSPRNREFGLRVVGGGGSFCGGGGSFGEDDGRWWGFWCDPFVSIPSL